MLFIDMNELIPENHLLKQIDRIIDFAFIYELAAPYYATKGRKPIDLVTLTKMLLIGYLYGIKSEHRLVEEVQLNIAYRWFCGLELSDKINAMSRFSETMFAPFPVVSYLYSKFKPQRCMQTVFVAVPENKKRSNLFLFLFG